MFTAARWINICNVLFMFAAITVAVNNPEHGFCRDCMALQSSAASRCERCGSPRLARHPELRQQLLAALDEARAYGYEPVCMRRVKQPFDYVRGARR